MLSIIISRCHAVQLRVASRLARVKPRALSHVRASARTLTKEKGARRVQHRTCVTDRTAHRTTRPIVAPCTPSTPKPSCSQLRSASQQRQLLAPPLLRASFFQRVSNMSLALQTSAGGHVLGDYSLLVLSPHGAVGTARVALPGMSARLRVSGLKASVTAGDAASVELWRGGEPSAPFVDGGACVLQEGDQLHLGGSQRADVVAFKVPEQASPPFAAAVASLQAPPSPSAAPSSSTCEPPATEPADSEPATGEQSSKRRRVDPPPAPVPVAMEVDEPAEPDETPHPFGPTTYLVRSPSDLAPTTRAANLAPATRLTRAPSAAVR